MALTLIQNTLMKEFDKHTHVKNSTLYLMEKEVDSVKDTRNSQERAKREGIIGYILFEFIYCYWLHFLIGDLF